MSFHDAATVLRARGEFANLDRLSRWREVLGMPPDLSDAVHDEMPPELANLNMLRDVDESSARGVADAVACTPLDLPNQRVVAMDVQRTRGEVPEVRGDEDQAALQRVITHFCKGGYAWRPSHRRRRAGEGLVVRTAAEEGGTGAGAAPAVPPAPAAIPPVGYKQVRWFGARARLIRHHDRFCLPRRG